MVFMHLPFLLSTHPQRHVGAEGRPGKDAEREEHESVFARHLQCSLGEQAP